MGLAVLVPLVPNRRTNSVEGDRVTAREMLRHLRAARLRRPLSATVLLGLLTVCDGFLYLALQQRNQLAGQYFPLLYVGTNIIYLTLAVPLGRIADRIGRAKVLVGGHLVLVGVYVVAGGPFGGAAATVVALVLLGTLRGHRRRAAGPGERPVPAPAQRDRRRADCVSAG